MTEKVSLFRSALKGSAALFIALGGAFAGGVAHAQQANTAAAEDDVVVVRGIRGSLRSSMEVKRDAVNVVDAITAEDIGAFPDKNVSEALQRVTGVQIFRQDGEGRGISIRGTDPSLTRVEINGGTALSLTVGGTDRTVDFRDIPVEFISRLEVVKSPTANMTEGGIGGTVRVVTRRPFDSDEPYLAGSAQSIYSNIAESYDPKVSLIGSRIFGNTLGVLLSASMENRHLYSNNARTTGWIRRDGAAGIDSDLGFPAGDGVNEWIPEIPRLIIDRRFTERRAFSGIVEWRPNSEFRAYLDGTYANAHETVESTLMQLNGNSGVIDYTTTTEGQDHTVNHYEFTSTVARPIDLAFRNILGGLDRTQYTTTLGFEYHWGDNVTIDGRLDVSRAEVQNDEINSTATIFSLPRAIVDYRGSQRAPNFSFPGTDVTSGAAVNRIDAVFNPRNNQSEEIGQRLNWRYDFDEGSFLTRLSAGFQNRDYETKQILYGRTTRLNCATAPAVTSAGAVTVFNVPCSTISNLVDTYSVTNPIPFFPIGDLGYSGGVRFWNDNTLQTYYQTLAAVGSSDNVYAANPNANTLGSYQNFLETWSVEEHTTSAYVQSELQLGELITANLGVRWVDTQTTSSGFNRTVGAGGVVNFIPGSQDGGYTKTLPSLNVRFNIIPDTLVGRFTASEVLARSPPSQLALRRSLDIVGLTGSRGNPNLKPFQATQYDLGFEWYFGDGAFLSAGLFRKDITSFIINSPPTPEVVDGVTYNITSPINGTSDVQINGYEIGLQYAFDWLPGFLSGFGFTANYTHQESEGFLVRNALNPSPAPEAEYPFPGLSQSSYNYSVYYEDERFRARATYNWRDQWLITANGRGNLPEYNEAFGSLDASVSYDLVPERLTLFLEGINLTDEVRIENNSPIRRIGNETYGQRYFFGLRARM